MTEKTERTEKGRQPNLSVLSVFLTVRQPGPHVDPGADALLAPAKLEVFLRQQPLALRRVRRGQVPEQQLLADGRRGHPDSRLNAGVERRVFGPESGFADRALHAAPPSGRVDVASWDRSLGGHGRRR